MNQRSLALLLFATLPACDTNERCVANCEESTGAASEDGSATDAQESVGLPTGGAGLTCEEVTAIAEQFIETHRACDTFLDCEANPRGVCFPPADVPGMVSLSLDDSSEEDAWRELEEALADLCPCVNPVSVGSFCSEVGECEAYDAEADSQAICPFVPQDIETFLAANKACTTAADCVPVQGSCYVDACSVVALNTEADTFDWMALDSKAFGCAAAGEEAGCNFVADCAAEVACSDEGLCIVEPS